MISGSQRVLLDDTGKIATYQLNPDGSYQDVNGVKPDFYILGTQASKIWDASVRKMLAEKFGNIVGVICESTSAPVTPAYQTFKYILGG